MYHIVYEDCFNYNTDVLDDILEKYGKNGFQLVSTIIVKGNYDVDVLRLFFQKQIKD